MIRHCRITVGLDYIEMPLSGELTSEVEKLGMVGFGADQSGVGLAWPLLVGPSERLQIGVALLSHEA